MGIDNHTASVLGAANRCRRSGTARHRKAGRQAAGAVRKKAELRKRGVRGQTRAKGWVVLDLGVAPAADYDPWAAPEAFSIADEILLAAGKRPRYLRDVELPSAAALGADPARHA